MKAFCISCNCLRNVVTELEPVTIETVNDEVIEIQGKKSYCSKCDEEIYIEEDRFYNLEQVAHVIEKGRKYKGGD